MNRVNFVFLFFVANLVIPSQVFVRQGKSGGCLLFFCLPVIGSPEVRSGFGAAGGARGKSGFYEEKIKKVKKKRKDGLRTAKAMLN